MSFTPHEAQVQFALERAIIGVLGTMKLPYPPRAFDMAHCSRCLTQWGSNDGMYMMEVDRVLRPGGYLVLSGPPINWRANNECPQEEEQKKIEEIAQRLCWEKIYEKGEIAIWRKCSNNDEGNDGATMCRSSYATDVWCKKMEACVSPDELKPYPKRLNDVVLQEDTRIWKKHINVYKKVNKIIDSGRYRNIMDMNAGLGSFAAALESPRLWVMNVVPTIAEKDTLGVIYERGFIGLYHDWCEAFSTYPRTFDLIHASALFSLYKGKCKDEDILLEMDRILRPEGAIILRDNVDVLMRIKRMVSGMRWNVKMMDHEDSPLHPEKILFAVKQYWVAEDNNTTSSRKFA